MAVDGTYNITVETPLGKQAAKLALKADDNVLSGSIEAEIGGLNEFSGGAVNGNDVTWKMELNSPLGKINLECKGMIAGDEISGEVKAGDFGTSPFKGKRA
jgi:hypothetical protein